MGIFRGKDGNFNFTSLGPMATAYSAGTTSSGAFSPDSGTPSLDQDFYNDLINALAMGDTSQAAFEQAAETDLINQLTTPVQPGSNIPTLGGSAPSTNPLQDAIDAIADTPAVETLTDAAKAAGTEVGKVIDKVFQSIGLPSPTKVIGNPKPGATVVWGQTSGSPVIYTGTTPSGTQTGVTTGLPWLDAIIDRSIKTATGQAGVPDLGAISTVVIQEAARDALGLPAGADMGQITDAISKVGQATVAATTMAGEDTEGTDLFGVDLSGDKKIGDPNGDGTVTTGDGTVTTGDGTLTVDAGDPDTLDVLTDSQPKFTPVDIATGSVDSDTPTIRAGARNIVGSSVGPDTPAIKAGARNIVGGTLSDDEIDRILAGGRPAVAGGYDDPSTTPSIKTGAAPAAGGGDGGGGGGGGSGTTAPSGGIRTVSGGPGPSVDIDYLYDFAKGLEQPFQATEEEEEDIVRAAEGGMIGNTDDFERILRILRGG